MNDYAPASSLGWLDFDEIASERVATLLRSLEEPATLDVLGLGTVRDAFADMLSPGTSTVQTRLRYFVFLPWIFQRLEAERVPPADFARRLREAEAKLIGCLKHLGSGKGVIGRVAGRKLKRMPSDIYWSGLGAWGIRKLDLSIAGYGQRAAALGRHRPQRDDDETATARAVSMWAAIPPPPGDFLHADIDFELRPDEAHVLAERIRQRHPNTLLAFVSATPDAPIDVPYPWMLPTKGMPDSLVEALHHARCFSELTLGPRLVYNVLLARRARKELGWDTDKLEEGQIDLLDEWAALVSSRRGALGSWVDSLPEFWSTLTHHRIGAATQSFVKAAVSRAVDNPERFAEDPAVHDLIRHRELRLKSKRARLVHRSALENWQQTASGGQLDYRWPTTKSYLADLAAAAGPTQDRPGSTPSPEGYATATAPAGNDG